jgi:hypothetical protein
MPPVTLAAVVDLTKIKMKWKEIYVSEGLNRKVIPSTPKGIYSGLRLIQNLGGPTDRQVEISSAPDGTHAAVHQSSTGFSTTYHDNAGISTILNLNSVSLDNQETVITLSITYVIGADTVANWIAYPIADWNLLTDAQRAERIVLGTINVPAAATNITSAMILPARRTIAWESAAPGSVAWTPIVKNGDFEFALDDGVFGHAATYWESTQSANGEWKVQSVDPQSGARALAFNQLIAAATTSWIDQTVGIPVVAGQLMRCRLYVKNLKVPTGGTLSLRFIFADSTYGSSVASVVSIPMTGIDASYRVIDGVFAVPATAVNLYVVRIENTLSQGTTGIAFRIDGVQAWLEAGSALDSTPADEGVRQTVSAESLIIEDRTDPIADYFGTAALLHMPISNEVWLERRDRNTTASSPIQLALRTARITQLGADLLNTEARAILPRIEAGVSVVGGVELTLMWQSVPTGQPGYRKYVSATGQLVETVNALWGGATWSKDQVGQASVKRQMSGTSMIIQHRLAANNAAWADGAWDSLPFDLAMLTGLTMGTNLNISLQGTGYMQAAGTLYLGRQVFTASGTYTPTVGTRRVLLRMTGGGGGGSGVGASATGGKGAAGAGGASGTYIEKLISPGVLITGGTITIGAGGAGGVGSNAGATGADTAATIQAVTYTAKGGFGGPDGGSNLGNFGSPGHARKGPLYQTGSSTGDINSADLGNYGIGAQNSGDSVVIGGSGGSGRMGIGGASNEQGNGNSANGHGAGGGGASNWQDGSAYNGGAAAAGIVLIDEYY